ncbi:MAG: hypothetical protein ICV73_16480, partial [Acetobacteraceae bacterium]|nr:hypothetical protein [Acetobacteraceae bacterium]
MSATTGFVLRHILSERAWHPALVAELVDPVSGTLVHRDVAVRAVLGKHGPVLKPSAVSASGRFVFRGIAPGEPATLVATPRGAPFFPAEMEVPPAASPSAPRQARVVLVPHRGYPFAAEDSVVLHRLLAGGKPVVGAEVALDDGGAAGLLAAPARTDADGEFVLHLRPDGARRPPNGGAPRPAADGPMPPGLGAAPTKPAGPAAERRLGLVFTRGKERRRLPAEAGPILPARGRVAPAGPEDAIRWEALVPMDAA